MYILRSFITVASTLHLISVSESSVALAGVILYLKTDCNIHFFTFTNHFTLLGNRSAHFCVFAEIMLEVRSLYAQNHQKILKKHSKFREEQPFLTHLFQEKVKRTECTLFAGKNKGSEV